MLDDPVPATLKKPSAELVRLLETARERDGRSWYVIAVLADVPYPTIQGWLTNVGDPRLNGVMRVAAVLGISGNDIAEAVSNREELLRDLEDLQRRPSGGSSGTGSEPGRPDRS